jgi:alanine racemase
MSGTLVIDVDKIKEKLSNIRRVTGAKICAVVKANAYGVGTELCTHIAEVVDYFAVATIAEAQQLARLQAGKKQKPILVLSPSPARDILALKTAELKEIEFAVDSLQGLRQLIDIKRHIKVHLAINTGMNRYGADASECKKMLKLAKNSSVEVVGLFSHFFDQNKTNMQRQYEAFEQAMSFAKKKNPQIICHISNSGGTLYPADMVRIGIGMYCLDDPEALGLYATISKIRTLHKGETLGYNAHFVAQKTTRIAIVPLGYADGIRRKLSGASVLVGGVPCKIVGDICMDCFFIDISGVSAKVGTTVTIFGKYKKSAINICTLAERCDTISYEILTGLGSRIKRKYIGETNADNFW